MDLMQDNLTALLQAEHTYLFGCERNLGIRIGSSNQYILRKCSRPSLCHAFQNLINILTCRGWNSGLRRPPKLMFQMPDGARSINRPIRHFPGAR